MRSYKKLVFIAILIIVIPIALNFYLLTLGDVIWNNFVFHYYYVILSSLISFALSIFAYLEYKKSNVITVYLISIGFLGVSILYGFHALITPGYSLFNFPNMRSHINAFVFFGDFSRFWLAMLIFIPELNIKYISNKWSNKRTLLLIGLMLILFSTLALLNPEVFPHVKDSQGNDTYFSILFKVLTLIIIGIEIIRYYGSYVIKPNIPVLSLIVGNIMIAEVVLIFMFSKPWGLSWWLAHNLFLLSYLIIGSGVIYSYLSNSKFEFFDVLNQLKDYVDTLNARNKQLFKLANNDLLTDLPNRNYFMKYLGSMINESKPNDQFGLLFIDLDGFKKINDNYGHYVGDQVLQTTANRISECLIEGDIAARIGGDEFLVLVHTDDRNTIAQIAKDIIESLTKTIHIDDINCYVGASIGIALFPIDGKTVDELITNSDKAMYDVKENGKNNYKFIDNS